MKHRLSIILFWFILALGYSQEPNDCAFSVTVCGNSNLSIDVSGIGTQELSGSNTCSSSENNSIWLEINIATSGTLGFVLTPDSNAITEDYDFFVFGPNVSCGNIGQAIRCSTTNPAAAGQGNNLTGMNDSETDVSEGPGADGNSFVSELNVLAGENYFIVIDRPIGNSPFSLEWTGSATFPENPMNPAAPALFDQSICDNLAPISDGIGTFDITDLSSQITTANPSYTVSYHLTESDANIDASPLGNMFQNTIPFNQRIYARIEDSTSGCYILEELDLAVNAGPFYNEPQNYNICDDLDDGDNTNGISIFNLNDVTDAITNGFNPLSLSISYFSSQNDAQNNSNRLPNNITVSSANVNEIFVRIELNLGCIYFTSFLIEVQAVPEVVSSSIFQCDEFGPPDGTTIFNLSELNSTVSMFESNRAVTYHLTRTEANSNLGSIEAESFINTENPQTLYARVRNTLTGCFNVTSVILETSDTGANNAVLNICDEDGLDDGFTSFNLSDADAIVLSGLPSGLDIAYYQNINDALIEQNQLNLNYTNTTESNQLIYARVEDNNNCYGISEVELNVLDLPDIETEFETIYCLNNFPDPIVLTGGVQNDSPNNYLYQWSTGETTSEIQINEPGTYTVEVSNVLGCSKIRTITATASNTATITNIEVVDASENNSISFSVSGEGDYEFALNSVEGPYQDESFFDNLPPELYTLFIRDKNGCGIVEQEISVIGFPKFFTPNGDGVNDFWRIKGIVDQNQLASPILVYNRYGKLITEIDPLSAGWDGRYKGNIMPSSDYWFTVTLPDGRKFTSHFSLKR